MTMELPNFKAVLKQHWGYPDFRPLQEDIIRSVALDRKDTLGLLPTGGGKSIIFQVPAMALPGICLVVTPLIALMKDQVANLKQKGIKAVAIFSGMSAREIDIALDNCVFGDFKFLYLSPERLRTDIFRERVKNMKVNLLAIDEAHCISQWGYDFRPSYLLIAELRELLPEVPVLALTATATPGVVVDIQDKLRFKVPNVFQKSFERRNLIYIVRHVEDKFAYLLRITQREKGTGVVYVRNRKRTREISDFLNQNGVSADFYHAGLPPQTKDYKQENWKRGHCRVIVSTNAFGMGIDKPDVRFVAHMDLPDSLEAYFQEAGRAGRDEKTAYAILLYNATDRQKLERGLRDSFPEREVVKRIYQSLGNYYQIPTGAGKDTARDFRLVDFAERYKLSFTVIHSSLKLLEAEGYIVLTDELNLSSRVKFLVSRDDLYKMQVENAAFDAFVKLLLRSYTGLFADYVNIDEDSLARTAKTDRDTIQRYLKRMRQLKVMDYIPEKKTPQVVFATERLDEKSIRINKANYEDRRERMAQKIAAVLSYAENFGVCRSQQLLAYFGETDTRRCGNCDVCRRRNELNLSTKELNDAKEQVQGMARQAPVPLHKLAQDLDMTEAKAGALARWLLEQNMLVEESPGLYRWSGPERLPKNSSRE